MTALDAPAERPDHQNPETHGDTGTSELPVPPGHRGSPRGPRSTRWLPEVPFAWPLWALIMLYPLWWLLGLGTFIFPLAAVPMGIYLLRRCRPIKVPPGFGIWLLFLAWFCVSV